MPADTIERAVKRGAGTGEGAALAEVTYEGYGPGGAAILVEAMTDNRNRSVAEVRNAFARGGGHLGESGCVAWLFEPKGVIAVDADGGDPDEIALRAIDAGADDFRLDGPLLEVFTAPGEFDQVRDELEQQQVRIASAEMAMIPTTALVADQRDALAVLKLMERLEDLDDVQRVYSNVEFSDEVLREFGSH